MLRASQMRKRILPARPLCLAPNSSRAAQANPHRTLSTANITSEHHGRIHNHLF